MMMTSPEGGYAAISSASPFGCFVSTALSLTRLSLRRCNQLYGLFCEEGFFLGLHGIATTDFLWQESELRAVRSASGEKPHHHVLPLDAVAVWSQF